MTLFKLTAIDHIGIRIYNAEEAIQFYKKLGFKNITIDQDGDYEITNEFGLRINLMANASTSQEHNVLLDEPIKHSGFTHVAFAIEDLEEAMEKVVAEGIKITEGPKDAPRRKYFFIRDPDGNVLEFNELKKKIKE